MNRAQAEELGLDALMFLVARPERLHAFLNISGLAVEDLQQPSIPKGVLAGALGFVGSEEEMAREFAHDTKLKPGALEHALHLLDGVP